MRDDDRQGPADASAGGARYRNVSGRPLNRRVVLKAAAGFSALALGAAATTPAAPVMAEQNGGTRANHWAPQAPQQGLLRTMVVSGDWITFQPDYPISAIGVSWPGDVGLWPVVEIQLSTDGSTWSDSFFLQSQVDQGVRKNRDGRIFTPLLFSDGATSIRYRTIDSAGNPGEVAGIEFTYIDSTDGPWEKDIGDRPTTLSAATMALTTTEGTTDDSVPPQIVTRAQWGADESWRFDKYGEIWPPEYITVHHIIIHHTETSNTQDPVVAIRAIYYYHAVDQGWGDIGYNYLVDRNGTIYQGRVGGQNVVGGHSYQYAFGSSGISIIGNYQYVHESDAAKAGLVSIVAWVGRFLDPYGKQDFLEIKNLPVICAHRDVNDTTCPGDMLYGDIPEIRDLVAATLDSGVQETPNPGGIIVGDRVRVQTDDGSDLNLRSSGSGSASVVGTIPNRQTARVIGGPKVASDGNWYQIQWSGGTGWATAQFLIVDPPEIPVEPGDYPYGLNMRYTSSTNIRTGPSTSAGVIQAVARNTWAFILAGPEQGNSYTWYQLRVYQVGDGWSIKDNITPAPVDNSPAGAKFKVGDWVYPRNDINVRTRPGLAQTVIGSAFAGMVFQITQPAIGVTEHIWYGAYADKFGGGWVAEDDLVLTSKPGTPSGKFKIGDQVRTTDVLNLRSSASTGGSIIAVMPTGTTGKVLDGPRSSGGYVWWKIETSYGSGWAVEDWLAKVSTSPPPPPPASGKFRSGDQVKTTDALNLRSGASTGSSVIAVLPAGATGTVTGGPRTGNGYTWWQIKTSYGTGWAVEDWLAKVSTSPPPPPPPASGKFRSGDSVRTTDYLNLRTSPGGSVIAVLPTGTAGTVTGGPTTSGGYTWWQIRTSSGTGWVAEDWLAKASTSPPPPPSSGTFRSGDSVRTTDFLNLRTSPGGGVIAVMPSGTTGTVTGGPTSSGGYTWWQIRTSYGTGWAAEDWLTKASSSPPPPPSSGFAIGSIVKVADGPLNMRSGPGTGNGVVNTLPTGTRLTVLDGPRSGNGYTWYQVNNGSYGTGWCASDFLTKA